jgi:hypothetical protein
LIRAGAVQRQQAFEDMGLQQATTFSVVLFAAATFILWIPKIVVASREYNVAVVDIFFIS